MSGSTNIGHSGIPAASPMVTAGGMVAPAWLGLFQSLYVDAFGQRLPTSSKAAATSTAVPGSALAVAEQALAAASGATSSIGGATATAGQALALANIAESAASSAATVASGAQTTADQALALANTAGSAITDAATAASDAQTTADQALSLAGTAESDATAATALANSAATAAGNAQTTADQALALANTAEGDAASAVATANQALSLANTAETIATGAAATAGGAVATANSALAAANSATLSVGGYSLSAFSPPTADLAMAGFQVSGLGTPTASGQAAEYSWTLAQIQASSFGIASKPPVAAVATTNAALSGAQTIDGVALVAGARVLLTAQTTASQNGPWIVASGAWSRPTDETSAELDPGALWLVSGGGTAYAGSQWQMTTTGAITPDTTPISIVQFSAGQSSSFSARISASGGLLVAGGTTTDTLSVTGAFSAPAIDGGTF